MRIGPRPSAILSDVSPESFVGRDDDLGRIVGAAKTSRSPLIVNAPPLAGTSELLRQAFDLLFREHGEIIPIYFALRPDDGSARSTGKRFFYEFLIQLAAFRLNDPTLMTIYPTLSELRGFLPIEDQRALNGVFEAGDDAPLRTLLASPLRLTSGRVVVIFDDLLEVQSLKRGRDFLSACGDVFRAAPTIFAGINAEQLNLPASTERIEVSNLSTVDAGTLAENDAHARGLKLSPECGDLICLQCGNRPALIKSVIARAGERGDDLTSFVSVQRAYSDMLSGESLAGLSCNDLPDVPAVADREKLDRRRNQEKSLDPLVLGSMLTELIGEAPLRMAARYKDDSAIGVESLLARFHGQKADRAVIDYEAFEEELKGLSDEDVRQKLSRSGDEFQLPSIIYTAPLSAIYHPLSEHLEPRRSAVGFGFRNGDHKIAERVVWMAAEIPSKLEASLKTTKLWYDRLEAEATASEFEDVRFWLIAPEGFDADASEFLKSRDAIGSSRGQIDLLREALNAPQEPSRVSSVYEISVPMADEAEMIAARTLEDIGSRHGLPAKTLNQVRTALIEASINAIEHSHSPDRQLRLRFEVLPGTIKLVIANRGVRLVDQPRADDHSTRRGWGLKLMRQLMDEVLVDQTDDGTALTLIKYFDVEEHATRGQM